MNRRLGHRPEIARTSLGLGRVLRATKREREGAEYIFAARTDAAAMRMTPLVILANADC
jgi:hypothetical protein